MGGAPGDTYVDRPTVTASGSTHSDTAFMGLTSSGGVAVIRKLQARPAPRPTISVSPVPEQGRRTRCPPDRRARPTGTHPGRRRASRRGYAAAPPPPPGPRRAAAPRRGGPGATGSARRSFGGTPGTGRHRWPSAAARPRHQLRLMGYRGRGEIDVHAVPHRFGIRHGDDVDAHGGVGIGPHEARRCDAGRTVSRAGHRPAECLRPEPADRRVVAGLEIHLHESQRHAVRARQRVALDELLTRS